MFPFIPAIGFIWKAYGIKSAVDTLRSATTLESIVATAHSLKRAVDLVPDGVKDYVDLTKPANVALQGALIICGKRMLHEQTNSESDSDTLTRQYLGLSLIGRSGGTLTGNSLTNIILSLMKTHGARAEVFDSRISRLLQTWRPEKADDLIEALAELPEVQTSGDPGLSDVYKTYIVAALGGDVVLPDIDLLTEFTKQFPETQK